MRIVHCLREPVGGLFRHVCDLVDEQHAKGHDVGIVCDQSTGGDAAHKALEALSGKLSLGLIRVPMEREPGLGDLRTARTVHDHLRAMAADIIHAHGAKGGAYARLGRLMPYRRLEAKVVYCAHGGSLHYKKSSPKGRLFFAVERLLERGTDGLVFVCEFEKNAYAAKVHRPRALHEVIYNGISAAELVPVEQDWDAADFLYIGAMRDLKGPDLFLMALKELHATGKKPTAVMVGDGPDKERYERLARNLRLEDSVIFHPAMPARQAFKKARCVVLPSRAESFPYIVLEALGAGKPVIAADVGGVSEIFGADRAALVPPQNVPALAEKMLDFKKKSRPYKTLAEKLHIRLAQDFTQDVMAEKVERFYRRVLEA